MSNLLFVILSIGLVGGLYFVVRSVLNKVLRFSSRSIALVVLAVVCLLVGVLLLPVLQPLEATGYNLTAFATESVEVQANVLAVSWADVMGYTWAGLFIDVIFLVSYTTLLMFTWTWISEEAKTMQGHGLIKIIDGFMLLISFAAGSVDLLENTAVAFMLTGNATGLIRFIASEMAQFKFLLPLLPLFTSPAAGLWMFTTRKTRKKLLESREMKKSLKKLRAMDPDKLFLGPIIGGMTSSPGNGAQVKLWGKSKNKGKLYAWIGKHPDLTDAAEPVGIAALKKENGFAAVVPIKGLPAGSVWHYALTFSSTPPGKKGRKFPLFSVYPEAGKQVPFNFYFGSCFRPEFPLPAEDRVRIFQSIKADIEKDFLRFGLMTGDQVYADSIGHNGMNKIPETAAEYRRVYAHSWTQRDLRSLLQHLPVYMTLDDHEIDDDWRWVDVKKKIARNPLWVRLSRWLKRITPRNISLERLSAALHVFYEHQLLHAPDLTLYPSAGPGKIPSLIPPDGAEDPGGACYSFTYGDASFFVLDVRTRRTWRLFGEKNIMDEPQWHALESWLRDGTNGAKFIVSSSGILMRYWYDLIYDRWGAYKADRNRIIEMIAENDVENVFILSGDVHTANAVSAELEGPDGKMIILREFCASPFQQESGWLKKYGFDTKPFGRVKKITFHHEAYLKPNYGVVRVAYTEGRPEVKFEIRDVEGQVAFSD